MIYDYRLLIENLRCKSRSDLISQIVNHQSKIPSRRDIEENKKQQSCFYRTGMITANSGLYHLAQVTDEPDNPPEWGDYYNSRHAAYAVIGGAVVGTYVFTKWGAAGGTMFPIFGPWSPFIGGAFGSIGGFIIGTFGGYGAYKQDRAGAYDKALDDWCNDKSNGSHPDYPAICVGTADNTDNN